MVLVVFSHLASAMEHSKNERERDRQRERERGLVNYKHLEKNGYNNIPLVCKSCRSQQPQQLTLIIKKPPPILTKIFLFSNIFLR